MNFRNLLIIGLSAMIHYFAYAQENSFTVNGLNSAFSEGKVCLLNVMTKDTLAEDTLKYGRFCLKGSLKEKKTNAQPAMLSIVRKDRRRSISFPFALEEGNLSVSIDSNGKPFFGGSPSQWALSQFALQMTDLEEELKTTKDTIVLDSLKTIAHTGINQFIKDNYQTALRDLVVMYAADLIQRQLVDASAIPYVAQICTEANQKDVFHKILCMAIEKSKIEWTGKPAPIFEAKDEKGNILNVKDLIGEKLLIVDFWASWCGPCIKKFEDLKALEEKYPNDIQVITISIDSEEKAWKTKLEKLQLSSWKHIWDADESIKKAYNVFVVPTTFVIDLEGKVVARNPEDLIKMIKNLK